MGSDPKRGWGWCRRGFEETSCSVSPPPPPLSLPSAPFLLGGSSRLLAGSPGQNRGVLGEVVMPGVWEVTLGEEGGRDAAGNAVKPPKVPPAPAKWEPWSRAVWDQSAFPGRRDPDPPHKAHPPAPTCATETLLVPPSPGP